MGPWSIQHNLAGVEKSSSLVTDSGMAVPEITLQNQDGKHSDTTEGEKTHTQDGQIYLQWCPKLSLKDFQDF